MKIGCQVTFEVDAHDSSFFIERGEAQRVVGLKVLPGLLQSLCFLRLFLEQEGLRESAGWPEDREWKNENRRMAYLKASCRPLLVFFENYPSFPFELAVIPEKCSSYPINPSWWVRRERRRKPMSHSNL